MFKIKRDVRKAIGIAIGFFLQEYENNARIGDQSITTTSP